MEKTDDLPKEMAPIDVGNGGRPNDELSSIGRTDKIRGNVARAMG
jgi:hypothetical protein